MSEGRPIRTEEMERLSAQLSPEARKVWLEMERLAELPQNQRQPDHRDKITELATQSMLLPDPDQVVLNGLIAEKQRALKAHAAQQKREGDALRWLGKEMQKEGLRRGMDKDERKRMTLKDYLRSRGKR
jgi:hypothetical protein